MPNLRILLACPLMTEADVWKTILSRDPDVELVAEATDAIDSLIKAGSTEATVVVIDLPPSGHEPGLYTHLLEEYPLLKVIAVSSDGSHAVKYEKGIIKSRIQNPSLQNLKNLFQSSWVGQDPISDGLLESDGFG